MEEDKIVAFTTNGTILLCEWKSGKLSAGFTTAEEVERLMWGDIMEAEEEEEE